MLIQNISNLLLIICLIFLSTNVVFSQNLIEEVYDQNNEGIVSESFNDMILRYDEFDDLYEIFPQKGYYNEVKSLNEEKDWFVYMKGQIGSGSLIGDVRVYMIVLTVDKNDLSSQSENRSGSLNILTNGGRISVKYITQNEGQNSLISLTGIGEDKWDKINQSSNPRFRLNGKIYNLDTNLIEMMKKLTGAVDYIRKNKFNIDLTFSDDDYNPKNKCFSREIIRSTDLNIIPREEGVVDFDIQLHEDGSVNWIRWDPVVGGLEPDITNIEEVKKLLKENWVFGEDTVSKEDDRQIHLEMRINLGKKEAAEEKDNCVIINETQPSNPKEDQSDQSDQKEEEYFVVVEQMPRLIGGMANLESKKVYPEMARRAGIEGRVTVQFIVNKQGNVENARVVRGIGGGCDEEALRVVREAKFEPGMQRGEPARVQYALNINFRL